MAYKLKQKKRKSLEELWESSRTDEEFWKKVEKEGYSRVGLRPNIIFIKKLFRWK